MTEVWDRQPTEAAAGFPWPPGEDAPILAAFGETWRSATFDPRAFFRRLPRTGGTGAAVLYYLAIGILVAGASLFWSTIGPAGLGQDTAQQMGVEMAPITSFLLTPLILLIALGLGAAVTHLMLLIVRGATHGIDTTLRVFCYAYSPMIFGVVPVIGGVVGVIWMLVLAIVGLGAAHQVATWKSALAVILPFLVLLGLFLLALLTLIAAGAAVLA